MTFTNLRPTIYLVVVTTILLFFTLLFFYGNQPIVFLSNYIVPDGVTYLFYLNEINNGYPLMEIGAPQFFGLPNSFMLWVIYLYPYYVLGFIGVLLVNIILVIASSKLTHPIVFLYFPYLLLSVTLPSKDLIIFALTVFLLDQLHKSKWISVLIIILTSFLVRDGAGYINLAIACGYFVHKNTKFTLQKLVVVIFFLCLLMSTNMEGLFGDSFVYVRNKEVSIIHTNENMPEYGTAIGYVARIFSTITNLSFRQPVWDIESNLSILGLFYYISGIVGLALFIYMVQLLVDSNLRQENEVNNLILIYFIAIFISSLNPMVSARYMIPVNAALIGNLYISNQAWIVKKFKFILPFSFFISTVVTLVSMQLEIFPPLNEVGDVVDLFSFK